ncbi:MAG: hypothetical protein D3919_04685 [Candidatus Electrothrix sp. AW5]|nr:hypothetical protein [Candidatus Electrothrix gigas]
MTKIYFPSLLFVPASFLIYSVTAILFSYDSLEEWILVLGVISDFFIILVVLRYAFFTNFFKITLFMYFTSIFYVILSFSFLYSVVGVYEMDGHLAYDYWSNIYFSTITWTALGYGDMYPSVESRKYVMLEVFVGYIHMSLLVSLVLKYLERGMSHE